MIYPEVVHLPGHSTPLQWPVAHMKEGLTRQLIFSNLGLLAEKGILVMPTSAYWNSQRKRGQDGRRSFFKQGTAHNDKLGFDWNNIEEHFAAADDEYTQHPETSAYKAFA